MEADGYSEARRIAHAFVEARGAARALPDYPGRPPEALGEAYRVQAEAIGLRGGDIAGWKVGRIWPPHEARVGANRLVGPIFADQVRTANGGTARMPVFARGFAAVEAEFLLRLGPVDPARAFYDLDAALDCVAAVHVGIEVASSPLPTINALGPAVTISDFGNNNGLVVGAAIPDWRDRGLDDWPVATLIDGAEVGQGRAAAFPDGLAGSVRFLLENLAARGIPAQDGWWVSTGAVTGVHEIAPGQTAGARFGDDHEVGCAITAEEPRA